MSYANIVNALYSQGWAITPEYLGVIEDVILAHVRGEMSAADIEARVKGKSYGLSSAKSKKDDTAVVSLHGPLVNRAGMIHQASGMTSPQEFAARVNAAANDPAIKRIVLDIDSPGGTVAGTSTAAKAVRDARGKKEVVAVANGTMASAAYWIGSQASKIVADEASMVGSVGVLMAHRDMTEKAAEEGIKTTYIRSSEDKAIAQPFEALTDEARAALQSQVDGIAKVFRKEVSAGRGVNTDVIRDEWSAKVFLGADALGAGLVDEIGSLDSVIASSSEGRTMSDMNLAAEDGLEVVAGDEGVLEPEATLDQDVTAEDTSGIEAAGSDVDPEAALENAEQAENALASVDAQELEDLRRRVAEAEAALASSEEDQLKVRVDSLVASAISEGRALPAHEELLRNSASMHPDFVEQFLAQIPQGSVSPANAAPVVSESEDREPTSSNTDLVSAMLEEQRQARAKAGNPLARHRA